MYRCQGRWFRVRSGNPLMSSNPGAGVSSGHSTARQQLARRSRSPRPTSENLPGESKPNNLLPIPNLSDGVGGAKWLDYCDCAARLDVRAMVLADPSVEGSSCSSRLRCTRMIKCATTTYARAETGG